MVAPTAFISCPSGAGQRGIVRPFMAARGDVVLAFATLPDEAFDFCVAQLMQLGSTAGGFKPESEAGLIDLSGAITAFFVQQQTRDGGAGPVAP